MIREVVGNDVVDLTDPAIADHHSRERFVSRVCAPEERARVGTIFDLWALFAAKEAAYKALVKIGQAPGFAHREIRVASDLRAVSWRGYEFELSVARGRGARSRHRLEASIASAPRQGGSNAGPLRRAARTIVAFRRALGGSRRTRAPVRARRGGDGLSG